ncbi:hypothetical protein AB0N38_33205 [Micromonospora aurantiaca]|uniref:hypothetical protein n=1 Tax=Micromonospora aurantiaca (nom. illeg.) TaxID=47850 RepID=UPI0034434B5E
MTTAVHVQIALGHTVNAPAGLWLLAGLALGRPVPAGERYPHICGATVSSWWPGARPVRLSARDCAACAHRIAGGQG